MEIEFNRENIKKCLCSQCKVQGKSQCVKNKIITLQEKALSSGLIGPEEFPALYCATGKEQCHDLDENEMCMCVNCPIWKENDLESGSPDTYFCLNGKSTRCYLGETNSEDMGRTIDLIRDYYTRVD